MAGLTSCETCKPVKTNAPPALNAPENAASAQAPWGSNLCRAHGAEAPQTKVKARRRLEQAADVLVQRLLTYALDGDTSDNVALSAVIAALDRAGISVKTAATVEVSVKPWESVFEGISKVAARHSGVCSVARGHWPWPPPSVSGCACSAGGASLAGVDVSGAPHNVGQRIRSGWQPSQATREVMRTPRPQSSV